jgi:hypothetical protein
MQSIPAYVSFTFIATTLLTLWFIYKASKKSNLLLGILLLWLLFQGFLAYSGFYLILTTFPPRFLILVAPPFLLILYFFLTKKGRKLIDRFDVKTLTYLHVVRIPVELVLWWLFVYEAVPQLITFEGKNWDILSGISAFFIGYFGYNKHQFSKSVLLAWNFICLGLLGIIVFLAIFSAPTAFQKFGFEQPNIGVFKVPFVFLPGFIVPVVLFSHLACIRKLLHSTSHA